MISHYALLGDVADFVNGYAFKPSQWGEFGTPIIRIQNLTDLSKPFNRTSDVVPEKYNVYHGDLLVSWSATLDAFFWLRPEEGYLNQHIFKVYHDKSKASLNYIYYCIKNKIQEMLKYTHGSTMKHINRKEFLETKIPLPPLAEQRRIAAILDKADAIRRKRQEALKLADTLLKSVFLDMFGDPVTNPKGWGKGTIRDIVSDVSYGTSKPANDGGKYIYLRMNNITYNGFLDLTNVKYIDATDNELKKYAVHKGDVLFNRTNSKELVGKTCVFTEDTSMVIAGYIIRIRVNEKAIPQYLSAILNSSYGKTTLLGMCKSIIGQANINAQELQDIKILIPPFELQKKFANIVEAIEAQKHKFNAHLAEADQAFKSLQQSFFG